MRFNDACFPKQILSSIAIALLLTAVLPWMAAEAGPIRNSAPGLSAAPVGFSPFDWSGIREAHEAWKHRFLPLENQEGFLASNPEQQWITEFDGRGFTTRPDHGSWTWVLELVGYGVGDDQVVVSGISKIAATSSRLAYRWDGILEEWFLNDRRGLEQGWSLTKRPGGSIEDRLTIDLAIRGSLQPRMDASGTVVRFVNEVESTSLVYRGLRAWDADGEDLPARFLPCAKGLRIAIDDREARYPITIDPIAQQAYLKASNVGPDYFGISVAIDGDTAVVGAYCEQINAVGVNQDEDDNSMSCSGAAYVFVRNGTTGPSKPISRRQIPVIRTTSATASRSAATPSSSELMARMEARRR